MCGQEGNKGRRRGGERSRAKGSHSRREKVGEEWEGMNRDKGKRSGEAPEPWQRNCIQGEKGKMGLLFNRVRASLSHILTVPSDPSIVPIQNQGRKNKVSFQ